MNTLTWLVQNEVWQSVASGLYIYVPPKDDGLGNRTVKKGKIAVIR